MALLVFAERLRLGVRIQEWLIGKIGHPLSIIDHLMLKRTYLGIHWDQVRMHQPPILLVGIDSTMNLIWLVRYEDIFGMEEWAELEPQLEFDPPREHFQ
jgi:hypothetical protein